VIFVIHATTKIWWLFFGGSVEGMTTPQPTLLKRHIGRRLRYWRHQAGKTQRDLIKDGVCSSTTTLQSIENGTSQGKVDPNTVARYLELCGADAVERTDLVEAARRTAKRSKGWWEDLPGTRDDMKLFHEMEGNCSRMWIYEELVVYGLFQTPEYSRSVIEATMDPQRDADHVDDVMDVRAARLPKIMGDRCPQVMYVTSFAALHQRIGGDAVMAEQVAHLRALARHPQIGILVVPPDAGAYHVMRRPFTVFEFADPRDPSVAYQDSGPDMVPQYSEDVAVVERYLTSMTGVMDKAIPLEDYCASYMDALGEGSGFGRRSQLCAGSRER
jgi:transcriptional regulator with XRE-family HTH domain